MNLMQIGSLLEVMIELVRYGTLLVVLSYYHQKNIKMQCILWHSTIHMGMHKFKRYNYNYSSFIETRLLLGLSTELPRFGMLTQAKDITPSRATRWKSSVFPSIPMACLQPLVQWTTLPNFGMQKQAKKSLTQQATKLRSLVYTSTQMEINY